METGEKRVAEALRFKDLRVRMLNYEDRYFLDMIFRHKNILNKIAKNIYILDDGKTAKTVVEDSWAFEFTLSRWIIAYAGDKYRLNKAYDGECRAKHKLIVVRKNKSRKEENNTILHEMIHAYEAILPRSLVQFLILYLYDKLIGKLGKRKLWEYINTDNHIDMRVHTPLFLLKSLDLDLKTGQPLGTIYSYQRVEYFK